MTAAERSSRRRRGGVQSLLGAVAVVGIVVGATVPASAVVPASAAPTGAATGATTPAASAPEPQDDPFYQQNVPSIGSYPNGTLLRSRSIDATVTVYGVQVPTVSWQLAYKSLDARRRPIVNVTTIVQPTAAWTGSGPRPMVAYQNAEDSTAWRCAVSYSLRSGSNTLTGQEQTIFGFALLHGFTLDITDYEGPTSDFLAGPEAATLVLDSVRAARHFSTAGLSTVTPLGLWGYSAGGLATGWVAEQAASYAPELHFAGAAYGGTPYDLTASLRKLDGGPFTAFALAGVAGLLHAYPNWDVRRYLNAAGNAAVDRADNACIVDVSVPLAFKRISDLSAVPNFLAVPAVSAKLSMISVGKAAPTMPTFIYNSGNDEVVSPTDEQALINFYCAHGTRVTHSFNPVLEHLTEAFPGGAEALDWLQARFEGRPFTGPGAC